MSTEANPEVSAPNRLKLDAKGRALPRTDAERAAQREVLRAALKRMAEIPDDDPPGTDEAFMREHFKEWKRLMKTRANFAIQREP